MHKEVIGKTEFVFSRVESSELLNEIFRLRYQVYCKECNFLREEDYPDGIEKDKYDPYSLHFVAQDQLGPIGTARLVLDSPHGFPPLEHHCSDNLRIDKTLLPRKQIAEISRLVISKEYRRRRNDGLYYNSEFEDRAKQTEALHRMRTMALGMYKEMYQESKRRSITHWYALMEKSLWLLLKLHNFNFEPIGDEIDVYGPVRPYLGDIKKMEKEVSEISPALFEYFVEGLESCHIPRFSKNFPG